jgi:hypothetical protein
MKIKKMGGKIGRVGCNIGQPPKTICSSVSVKTNNIHKFVPEVYLYTKVLNNIGCGV